jgi:hypothetical protein
LAFQPKLCMHFSFHPHAVHVLSISSPFI